MEATLVITGRNALAVLKKRASEAQKLKAAMESSTVEAIASATESATVAGVDAASLEVAHSALVKAKEARASGELMVAIEAKTI